MKKVEDKFINAMKRYGCDVREDGDEVVIGVNLPSSGATLSLDDVKELMKIQNDPLRSAEFLRKMLADD